MGFTSAAERDVEIAELKERLARQQALRRDLERELAESRSRQRELERRLSGITRTFTWRLGETLVAGRTLKGMLAMPGRFWRMWTDWLEKRRLDRLRPDAHPDTSFAAHLRFVDEVLDAHQSDGLAAAMKVAAALPSDRQREKARALVELAHVALTEDLASTVALAVEAAGLSPSEPRLKALAFRMFDLGEITAAARVLEAGRDLEFHPGDLPRRQAIAAYSHWRSGLDLGPRHSGAARSAGGILVVDGLSGARSAHALRRAEGVAADYVGLGRDVILAGASNAPAGVRPAGLKPPLASLAALDLLAEERAAALEAIIASEDIGLVHVGADLVSAAAAARAARATGARLVIDLDALPSVRRQRGPAWDGSEGFRICGQALAEIAAEADLVLARTPALARAVEQIIGRRPDLVFSDGAVSRTTTPRPHTLVGVDPGDRIVLLPRFSEAEPRSLAVVEAIAQVAGSVRNVRLVPVGAGRDFGPLRQRAHDLGVKDRLIAAEAARGAIEDLVARADVLLLDDVDTGVSGLFTPFSVAEARHLGVPIVAVAGPWAEGLLGEDDAWLARPGDAADLTAQIALALGAGEDSPRLRRARQRGAEEAAASRGELARRIADLGL